MKHSLLLHQFDDCHLNAYYTVHMIEKQQLSVNNIHNILKYEKISN